MLISPLLLIVKALLLFDKVPILKLILLLLIKCDSPLLLCTNDNGSFNNFLISKPVYVS